MSDNKRPAKIRYFCNPQRGGKTWAEKQWLEIDHKEETVIIEIAEKDFKEMQDKIGKIRGAAIVSKMIDQKNCVHRLDLITSWANEITALLHKGHLQPSADTTKLIERYDRWMCEKCGHIEPRQFPAVLNSGGGDSHGSCIGCQREITELVPLVREGG